MNKFYRYIDDVLGGKIIVNRYIKLAVERFQNDVERKEFVFDYKAGERVVNFCEQLCKHWKGLYAGKPIELLPHQHFYFIQLFGWKKQDGTRRFRRSYKEIARKNAKTTESAIKAQYLITKDGEHGAQVYACATKEDQATIVVNDAGRIIEASPDLKGRYELYRYKENIKRVVYAPTNSFIKPLGRDSSTQDGFDPHAGIIDEYHAHPDDGLVNVIQSGMGMRLQPLIDVITTAGFNQSGPCYALRKLCIDVLEGRKIDDSLLALIFTLDTPEEWENEECWIKANPNMADSTLREKIILPYLKQRVTEAKNEGSSKEVDVKTKNFNLWCDAPDFFISSDTWKKNTHGVRLEDLRGATCYGGLDLASGLDINALALFFPDFATIKGMLIHPFLIYLWIPEDKVRENREKVDYSNWVRDGHIYTTPGNIIDHEWIVNFTNEETQKYKFISGAYDPHLAHHGCVQGLIRHNMEWNPFGQGYRDISVPTKEFERRATAGSFETFGNPVFAWMVSCTQIVKDPNGNIKINKGISSGKIDGVAAAINALAQSMSIERIEIETKFTAL